MSGKNYSKYNRLGDKIHTLMLDNNFSVSDLQNYFIENNYLVTKKSMYQWLRNETIPNLTAIYLLVKFFKTDFDTLFNLNTKHISQLKDDKESAFIYSIRHNRKYKRLLINFMEGEKLNVRNWKDLESVKKRK